MYKIINWYVNIYIWQSISHVIGGLVDMLISYMYVCTCEICIWIYVPTCRNKCNWFTLKHLVLVRINGFEKSPKLPGNTFSDALLKSRFQNIEAWRRKKKKSASRGFFWRESRNKLMRTFNYFLPATLDGGTTAEIIWPWLELNCIT